MKRKIEEFDNYGVDLSRTCQHKTIPGGLFSITIMGVYLYFIINYLYKYYAQENTVTMKFLIDFDTSLAPVTYENYTLLGNITFRDMNDVQIKSVFTHFKLGFEYQTKDKSPDSTIVLTSCELGENNTCHYSMDLKEEYFKYHDLIYNNPKLIFQSCRTLRQKIDIIENPGLLSDCVKDSEMDSFYDETYIKNKYFTFQYNLPFYQVLSNGTIDQSRKNYVILFKISKEEIQDYYISEVNKINVYYQNKLFSYKEENFTYVNWINPKMESIRFENNIDYYLNIIFSFRLQEELNKYEITKTTFFETAVAIGGFLGLFNIIIGLNSFWNPYFFTKVIFKVYAISMNTRSKISKEVYNEKSNAIGNEEKKEEDEKDPREILKEEQDEMKLNFSTFNYCQWYWLTSCFNCSKRKKLFREKCQELLNDYQCKSCVRNINQSKWYDLSKLIPDDDDVSQPESSLNQETIAGRETLQAIEDDSKDKK